VDEDAGKVRDPSHCPHCNSQQHKRDLERKWETVYDRNLSQTLRRAKQTPVIINCSVGRKRHNKRPDAGDLAVIRRIEESDIPYPFPMHAVPEGDKTQ